jgi:hypothetical protein
VPDDGHHQPDQADGEQHGQRRSANGQRPFAGRGSIQRDSDADPQASDRQR